MKRNSLSIKQHLLLVLLALLFTSMGAQTLNKPTPADNPNLPGNSPWTAACASNTFNEYYVNFTWTTPLVQSDNQFILELSDGSGNFDAPTTLATATDKNSTFNFDFSFNLPESTQGSNYKMRVRSTNPAKIGAESDPFEMYYIAIKTSLLISKNGDGNIPSNGEVEVCDGGEATLQVHNITNPENYTYNWYRSGTLLTEKGHLITTQTAGTYFVEIDYGTICSGSANTLSNTIKVTVGTAIGVAINTPTTTVLCQNETTTLSANISNQGLTYTWYKDDAAITTPTVDQDSYTIDTSNSDFNGSYRVEISGNGVCTERSEPIEITKAGAFTVTNNQETTLLLLPGTTQELSVTTTATAPLYTWFKDGTVISSATTNTLTVTTTGQYYVQITDTANSCANTVEQSETVTVVNPDSFTIKIGYDGTYTDCTVTSTVLKVTAINAIETDGTSTDVTEAMKNVFNYTWSLNASTLVGTTNETIAIASAAENGTYHVEATYDTFTATSNSLNVLLKPTQNITLESDALVTCNPTDVVKITPSIDVSGLAFSWIKDGATVNTSDPVLTTNETGTYELQVTIDGCTIASENLTISPFTNSLITLNVPTDVVFPEGGSRTLNASGGTDHKWFDTDNNLFSTTSEATLNRAGIYTLLVTIDGCEMSQQITVTYKDNFSIPNVITANGDGVNDQWVIPNTYANSAQTNILIYNDASEEVLNVFNYQNNWPSSTTTMRSTNAVFYYKIRTEEGVVKQGTITVIR